MKQLLWMDEKGVRTFGCAACKWKHQVKQPPPESSEVSVPDGFHEHDCEDPSLKFDQNRGSALPGSSAFTVPHDSNQERGMQQTSPADLDGSPTSSANPAKRRWRRYEFHLPVTVTVAGKKIQALGTALNEGGMSLSGEAGLQVGDEVRVEFRPPFSNTVVNLAVVVRNRTGNRFGVEFIGATDAERQEIVLLRSMVRMLEARVTYYEERASTKVVD